MGYFSGDVGESYDREDKEWQIKMQMIDAICNLNPKEKQNSAILARESIETIRGKLGYLTRMNKNNNIEVNDIEENYDGFAFEENNCDDEFEEDNGFGRS